MTRKFHQISLSSPSSTLTFHSSHLLPTLFTPLFAGFSGEVYVLLVAARENPDEHWLDLWRGVPGASLRRFPLPCEWLDGGCGDGQLTPDGEFVAPGATSFFGKGRDMSRYCVFFVGGDWGDISICDMYNLYIYIYQGWLIDSLIGLIGLIDLIDLIDWLIDWPFFFLMWL